MSTRTIEKLWEAVEDGDVQTLKRLFKGKRFDPSFLEDPTSDETMLYRAVYNENLNVVKTLVEAGADINARHEDHGATPVLCALYENREEIAIYLYEQGADIYIACDDDEMNALEYAEDNGHSEFLNFVGKAEEEKRRADPQKVIFEKDYFDYKAQEIYDFDDFVRVIVMTDKKETALSFQRDTFKLIENEDGLQRAFNEHAKRGGKVPESKVFPNRMVKTQQAVLNRGKK